MENKYLIPGAIWITGLSASGKTTLGLRLYKNLKQMGVNNVEFLDGEELRKKLDRVYGYSVEERFAVIKNFVRIAREYNEKGKVVIVSTISHKRKMRELAREEINPFLEIYLKCPVRVCAQRDPKGQYRKAFAAELENFVGVTEPYEISKNPELILDTASKSIEDCSSILLNYVLNFLEYHLPCSFNKQNST